MKEALVMFGTWTFWVIMIMIALTLLWKAFDHMTDLMKGGKGV